MECCTSIYFKIMKPTSKLMNTTVALVFSFAFVGECNADITLFEFDYGLETEFSSATGALRLPPVPTFGGGSRQETTHEGIVFRAVPEESRIFAPQFRVGTVNERGLSWGPRTEFELTLENSEYGIVALGFYHLIEGRGIVSASFFDAQNQFIDVVTISQHSHPTGK